MYELKITGNSAAELVNNAVSAVGLLVNGALVNGAKAIAAAQKQTATAEPETPQPTAGAQPNPKAIDALDETAPPKRPRGRPPTKPKSTQTDLEDAIAAKSPPTLPPGGDPVPDLTGEVDKPAASAPTFEDCKTTLRQLYDNYIARAHAAGETDEKTIIAGKVAYAKQLVYGFGIQKLMELKPEQYAEFIAKAQPYLDGSAKLEAA